MELLCQRSLKQALEGDSQADGRGGWLKLAETKGYRLESGRAYLFAEVTLVDEVCWQRNGHWES